MVLTPKEEEVVEAILDTITSPIEKLGWSIRKVFDYPEKERFVR